MAQIPQMPMCGGTGQEKPATPEIQEMVDNLLHEVNAQAGDKKYSKLTAVSYKSQVVAGQNHFIKVKGDHDEHLHLRVHVPLPHTGQPPQLHGVQLNKKAADPVEHF